MARDAMETSTLGLPAGDACRSFPISDVHIVDSSEHPVETPKEQGDLGAKRKPDLLVVRKRAGKVPVPWTKVLTWFELKFSKYLGGLYDDERIARGLSADGDDVSNKESKPEVTVVGERSSANVC